MNTQIKFPCPVRRISLIWRDGQWIVENDIRIKSMTLPKSDELPEVAKSRGVTGFWYEAVDRQNRTIYRQLTENPFLGMEVYDKDGRMRRINATHREVGLEILIPDTPELEALHIYSSIRPTPHETEILEKANAEHISTIQLRKEKGGEHGHK